MDQASRQAMGLGDEESDSKISMEDDLEPETSSASSDPVRGPISLADTDSMAAKQSDRIVPQRTMRFIPVLEDRTLSASGSHNASFPSDEESFIGTVDAPARGA
ncbi:hypothetical protein MTO96_039610 [Rhipicephalus appendiculatus]